MKPGRSEASLESVDRSGNQATLRSLQRRRLASAGAPRPGGGEPLPRATRSHFEGLLGADLSEVRVHQDAGAKEFASALDANAVTLGPDIWARSDLLSGTDGASPLLLAHELVHTVQQGPLPPSGALSVSHPSDRSERQASQTATLLLQGLPAAGLVAPGTAPAQLARDIEPVVLPDTVSPVTRLADLDEATALAVQAQASELLRAVEAGDPDAVITVLRRNVGRAMRLVREAYGDDFFHDLNRIFTLGFAGASPGWGEVRALLGDALTLDEELRTLEGVFSNNRAAIFQVLEQLDDGEALHIVESQGPAAGALTLLSGGVFPRQANYEQTTSTLARLLGRDSSDYVRAVRLLLRKAESARAASGRPSFGAVVLDEGEEILLDPIARARTDLIWARIQQADQPGMRSLWRASRSQAFLALADLNSAERRCVAARIRGHHFENFDSRTVERLLEVAEQPDDGATIEAALREALDGDDHDALGMEIATERAGALLDRARRRDTERQSRGETSQPEFLSFSPSEGYVEPSARRLERLLHDPTLLEQLGRRAGELFGEPDAYLPWMRNLRVPESAIGVYRMRFATNFRELFEAVSSIPPNDRLLAVYSPNGQAMLRVLQLTEEQRESIDALTAQGLAPVRALVLPGVQGAGEGTATPIEPLFASWEAAATRSDAIVAAQRMLFAVRDGRPSQAFGILAQLTEEQRAEVARTGPYRTLERELTRPGAENAALLSNLRDALANGPVPALARYAVQLVVRDGAITERVGNYAAYEQYLAIQSRGRQDERRRGFVLWHRLQRDPAVEVSDADRRLAQEYALEQALIAPATADQRRRLHDAMLGAPRVLGPDLDPNQEADYLYYRLLDRQGLRSGTVSPLSWAGHDYDEAVTAFVVRYNQARVGGVSQTELAELVLLYHTAMRSTEAYGEANNSFARDMASIAGCVAGTIVVGVLSGGTLAPVAVGALAALAGGTAAASAGFAIRAESTAEDILRDFGTGAVEGALAAAGQALAARVVRGAALAGRGAAATTVRVATGQAVRRTAASAGAHLAEAVIDGAIGGAGGDLFQTALDEATWDQELSRVFASLLLAVGRGATLGAAGGLVGFGVGAAIGAGWRRLSARYGAETAEDILRAFEMAGFDHARLAHMDEAAQEALFHARALHAAGDDRGAARLLTDVAGLEPTAAHRVLTSLRERTLLLETAARDLNRTIDADAAAALSREFGVPVELVDGPPGQALVEYRLGAWGDPDAIAIHVSGASVADVRLHGVVVRRIRQFQREAQTLAGFFERVVAWLRGGGRFMPRGEELFSELEKHGLMMEARIRALRGQPLNDVTRARLEYGIAEINDWIRHFQDELGHMGAPEGVIAARRRGEYEELDFLGEAENVRRFSEVEPSDVTDELGSELGVSELSQAAERAGARPLYMTSLRPRGATADQWREALRLVRGGRLDRELVVYVEFGIITEDAVRAEVTAALANVRTLASMENRILNGTGRPRRVPSALGERGARGAALDWIGEDVTRLRELLDQLPFDSKGDIFESWFDRVGPPGTTQVPVSRRALSERGIHLESDRALDRVEAMDGRRLSARERAQVERLFAGEMVEGTLPALRIRELKGGVVSPENLLQIDDHILLLQNGGVSEVVLTVSRPEALRPVAANLAQRLQNTPGFVIEIVRSAEGRLSRPQRVTSAPELRALLGGFGGG